MQVETLPVGPFETNCYVVARERDCIVIDPGSDLARISDLLAARDLRPMLALCTHGHMDHICALAALCARFDCAWSMHPDDESWAFLPDNDYPPYYPAPLRPTTPFRPLGDGGDIEAGHLRLKVIATPGHTPGCVCLHAADDALLFTGDTLFAGSVGRTDLPRGDSRALTRSLRHLQALPECTTVYAGHGPATTLNRERRVNPYLRNTSA